ncbi:hypothetical protein WH95_00705 [Kiloniella litopenaei]|uniref:Right handed beta helix domain-containing protein n=1 Tax=Kiloniella litopenaei TaxID=1549748 RepID=A0A0M2RAG3_9PROT|nr:right-handed parallel beta-helix repeat-containing protein [Kiloniella litopenaei]KKJ78646.1 hypothetical protein WH95_00705 [Kiloniella litopenaei]
MLRKQNLKTFLSLSIIPMALLGWVKFEEIRYSALVAYTDITKGYFLSGFVLQKPSWFVADRNAMFTENSDTLHIKAGNWDISEPLVLDGELTVEPGTVLNFSQDSYLIVNGPLKAVGTAQMPIVFQGKDNQSWKGIYVHEATSLSKLRNVVVTDTDALKNDRLELTGGVTFYRSNASIKESLFKNSQAEDGLNIILSEFEMVNTRFDNMRSDAVDSDYSNGVIKDGVFTDIGGDGIDFSETRGWVENPNISDVHDKGISVGENSVVSVMGGVIKSVGVGVASKDGSVVDIMETEIKDAALFGLMTYVKKSSYNLPELNAYNLFWGGARTKASNNNWIRQNGTTLTINGQGVPEESLDVKALYRGPVMAK